MTVGIGSTVWIFDANHRVYNRPENGGLASGGPIWREHWRPRRIIGETPRSWLLEGWRNEKVPKKGGKGIAFSEGELDRLEFINNHAYKISDAVRWVRDFDALVKVAKLVGYELPPQLPTD